MPSLDRRRPVASFVASVLAMGAAAFSLAACSSGSTGDEGVDPAGSSSAELTRSVPPNRLLEDDMLRTTGHVSGDAVQAVLTKAGGPLATYREGGLRAADIVAQQCAIYGIAPAYMLARIQGESSLVYSGSIKNVAHATGCGCPDGERCDPSEAGFTSQVTCAAQKMSQYFAQIAATGETIADWGPGVRQKTLDGCTIVPANAATAALYTYTPWVGADGIGCGSASVGGSSEIAVLTVGFTKLLPVPAPAPAPVQDAGSGNDASESDAGDDAGDDASSM